jgi:hypothetical protein
MVQSTSIAAVSVCDAISELFLRPSTVNFHTTMVKLIWIDGMLARMIADYST